MAIFNRQIIAASAVWLSAFGLATSFASSAVSAADRVERARSKNIASITKVGALSKKVNVKINALYALNRHVVVTFSKDLADCRDIQVIVAASEKACYANDPSSLFDPTNHLSIRAERQLTKDGQSSIRFYAPPDLLRRTAVAVNCVDNDVRWTYVVVIGSYLPKQDLPATNPQPSTTKSLDWNGRSVSEVDLKSVAHSHQLKKISMERAQVGDQAIRHLAGLTQLEWLDLQSTQVTDAGLSQLGGLRKLKALDLRDTVVGDKGVKYVRRMRRMEMLDLNGTKITDRAVKYLRRMKKLHALSLENTTITDAATIHLAGLSSLRTLGLRGTRKTDNGLQNLSGLKELRMLYLPNNPGLTDQGIERLKQALPQAQIVRQ